MDGIMVLNTINTPNYSFGWNNWCWFLLIPIFLAIYFLCFRFINRHSRRAGKWGLIGFILLVLSLTIGIGVCSSENVTYDKSYQVLINNNVDMEQFRSNYEILDQVGITYIIRQK